MALLGTIKSIRHEKGFGFIRTRSGQEFFFHRTAVCEGVEFDRLQMGDKVTFEEDEDSKKGPRAVDVELA